ncbi:MAG: TIGR02099 family protein [Gammaproteobacteria bacterium]|nr:MAG: TIGR02099 family protein [Gammaproteobacteria bacterium]
MKDLLLSVVKKIGYLFATGIIIAALLVSVTRLLTPLLDSHRADFENWASQLLSTPVKIDRVRVSWFQYQPEITLHDVTILNEKKEPIMAIQKISIFFSITQSLWQWKPIPNGLMISGTDVSLYHNAQGAIAVQGFPSLGGFNSQPYQHQPSFDDIMAWVFTQSRLILRDIDIRYTQANGQKRFVTLYELNIRNAGTDHTLLGKAVLHQTIPTEVNMAVNWTGNTFDPAHTDAKIYLYVSGLLISQWMPHYNWHGWQLKQGIATAKLWATWHDGAFQKIQTTLQLYNLNLYSLVDHTTHKINRLSGNIGWKHEDGNEIFAGDDILIDLPSHLWPATSFYLSLAHDAKGTLVPKVVNIGYLDLRDVQSFLPANHFLADLQLQGDLQNMAITFSGPWTDWQHLSLNTDFDGVTIVPWHQLPGVKNLSGGVKWNGTEGQLSLHSNRVVFQYDSVFSNTIPIDQLSGEIHWQALPNNHWQLNIASLQIFNSDAAANINGTMTLVPNALPTVDLAANFTMQKADHIARYLPMRIFDPTLVEWLRVAFVGGEVESGHAVLRGQLSDFPFDKNNGTFLISGKVNKVDLLYAPDWPMLKQVSGLLTFSGRKMVVDVDQAVIANIPASHIHGEIPYLGDAEPQVLTVQSQAIQSDFTQGLNFIHTSPLEKTIGKMFAGMNVQGPMTLQLGLTIPLNTPEKTKVQGDVVIKEAILNLEAWRLKAEHLQGQLHFTEDTTEAKRIQGQLFNKPFTLSLTTLQPMKNTSIVRATLANNLSINDLEKWLKIPFSKVAQGEAAVKANIDFSLTTPIAIHLQSNLVGIAVKMPSPYGKKASESRDFTADIIAQEDQPLKVRLSYNKLLGAALIAERQHDTFNLYAANIQLGQGTPSWPTSAGLYITGRFDELDWDKIKAQMSQSSGVNTGGLTLHEIDIVTDKLNLFNQQLTQVHLQVTPTQNNWNIKVTSPQVVGEIQVPVTLNSRGAITAQFQKLVIMSAAGPAQKSPVLEVKSLPSISFAASNVSYNGMALGQVTFKTSPSNTGASIKLLSLASSYMNLQATGEWTPSGTRLQGSASSSNVSALLTSLGLDARNFIASNGKVTFNLNWPDAPFAPSLANLAGSASLDLGKGRIVDVGEASGAKMDIGRMLSIFSLQTIPRRLTFDFSDVFQKGYSFDSVRGNFSFRNGDAYTNNLRFDGPVAKVGIKGRIGLRNKDYDFILSVTPYVTSSIPVAATLLTGQPLIGLAAVAVNTVISSGMSKVTTYYYQVNGPWDNPSWKSVGSETAEKRQ